MSQLREKIASKEQELNELNESMSRLVHSNSEYEENVSEMTELLKTTAQSLSCAQDKNAALESEIDEVRENMQLLICPALLIILFHAILHFRHLF